MMKSLRFLLVIALCFCVFIPAVFAGGTQSPGGPAPIRWLCMGDSGAKPLIPNDRIVTGINQKLGINLIMEIVPQNAAERINVAIASGDFPDIVTGQHRTSATQNWIDNKIIIPLNPYFNSSPAIKELLSTTYSWDADSSGNFYGIPFISQYASSNQLLATRSDWLDKVGMKFPTNMTEFKAVLMAFTHNDPDGNGRNDTYGMTAVTGYNFPYIFFAFGRRTADYELDARGNIIPLFEHESFIPAMTYLKDLWDNGVIDPEYMVNDYPKVEEKFFQGHIGLFHGYLFRHVSRIENSVRQLYPAASLVYGLPPKGPSGALGMAGEGKGGLFTAITAACKTPDKAAAFIDFMISKEGEDYVRLGIEGVHFTRQGNTIIYNEAEREKDAFSPNGWGHPLSWGSFLWPVDARYLPYTEPARDRALETTNLATSAIVPNLIKYTTPAEITYSSIVNDIYQQYFVDMLTVKISIQQGTAALSRDWRAQGGDRILADVTTAYRNQR